MRDRTGHFVFLLLKMIFIASRPYYKYYALLRFLFKRAFLSASLIAIAIFSFSVGIFLYINTLLFPRCADGAPLSPPKEKAPKSSPSFCLSKKRGKKTYHPAPLLLRQVKRSLRDLFKLAA